MIQIRAGLVRLLVMSSVAAAAASAAIAQEQGEQIQGEVTRVELRDSPRTVTVRTGGGEVTAQIANRTRIVFQNGDGELSDLKPGMQVQFKFRSPVDRIQVSQPRPVAETRPEPRPEPRPTPRPESGGGRGEELKVRLLSVDEDRGEFRADVAGRRETYRVDDRRILRRFREGDLVVIVVRGRGRDEVVTDMRSAGLSGRVVRVDRRRREIIIQVDGRDQTYAVDDEGVLRDVRDGDRVRFEFEERSRGRLVITSIY